MNDEHFGTDLRLLRDLSQQSGRDPGRDLAVFERDGTAGVDLATLAGQENLRQALLLRFLTPAGSLAALGHPAYGSRLFELIGEPNTPTNRNRAKLFVLIALQAEPRVEEILSVQVATNRAEPSLIDIQASLQPIDSDTPLNLVFSFSLQGGESP